jgi:Tfp pilus assembly protein PilV
MDGQRLPESLDDMGRLSLTRMRGDEAGYVLIEVLISALLLAIVAAGVFTAFDASTRASARERNRARANVLAEQDLERTRSLRIGDLATLNQTRTVTLDGTAFTVVSRSQFLTETATTSTCASGTGSRDYLQLTSTVTWPAMGTTPPVTAATVVSPPSGSLVPNSGSLLVSITDSQGNGIPGVALSGTGAGTFNGSTGSTGCVLWRNLPAGTYSMTASGAASGMVDVNGVAPAPQTVSVVDQGTNTVNLQYDRPGSINNITFQTRAYGTNALVASSADSLIVFNSGMSVAKLVGTPGTPLPSYSVSNLFPFSSPYSIYAGTCDQNNPGSGPALASVTVPPGGSQSPSAAIQLPALQLTVHSGDTSILPGSPVSGARVTIKDLGTGCGNLVRTVTTNSSGQLPSPGLPYGTYEVCAQATIGGIQRRNYVDTTILPIAKEAVPVQNTSAGTVRDIYLGTAASLIATGVGATCP